MSSLLEKWACVSCILPGRLISTCPGKLQPDSLSTLTSLLSSSPSVTVLCVDQLCSYVNTLFLTALIWCSNSPQFGLWETFWLASLSAHMVLSLPEHFLTFGTEGCLSTLDVCIYFHIGPYTLQMLGSPHASRSSRMRQRSLLCSLPTSVPFFNVGKAGC